VRAAAVFVHGLFSSELTWEPLLAALRADDEILARVECLTFGYATPKFRLRLSRRIPDFDTVAASLSTFLDVECAPYDQLILIGHSQGGLIIQRYLQRMLSDSRGLELVRIKRVILLACPNNGSEFLLSLRKAAFFWHHPHERSLRPLNEAVLDCLRTVVRSIVYAQSVSRDSCPIPFSVYAGAEDAIVKRGPAMGVFPTVGALPGDHNTILTAGLPTGRIFTTIKHNLLRATRHDAVPINAGPVLSVEYDRTNGEAPLLRISRSVTSPSGTIKTKSIDIFDSETRAMFIQQNGAIDELLKLEDGEPDGE
jgi:pimeloyl-ACP methyl ester carboxylesterase